MIRLTTIIVVAMLAGCSVMNPDNEIRISEYKGEGRVLLYGAGEIGGCRITQRGQIDESVCINYEGERCSVTRCSTE